MAFLSECSYPSSPNIAKVNLKNKFNSIRIAYISFEEENLHFELTL